jgi:hypothetical protein
MNGPVVNPIRWNEEIGRYVEGGSSYTGPSTKSNSRTASDVAVQHHIARQLEIIARALTSINNSQSSSFSSANYLD